ncbi:MAG: hypothetical protein WC872_01195 [Candidatus Absconditabacterales bacterium]
MERTILSNQLPITKELSIAPVEVSLVKYSAGVQLYGGNAPPMSIFQSASNAIELTRPSKPSPTSKDVSIEPSVLSLIILFATSHG